MVSPAIGIPAAPPSYATGIGLAALGFALFTGMDTLVKWLSAGYQLSQIIFFNSLFALGPVVVLAHLTGGLAQLRTRRLPLHLMRGSITLAGAFAAFYGYSVMPLADAYAINFSAPLFITLLSVLLLKEPVGWRRWSAVAVGFVGVLIMLRPGAGIVSVGAFAVLGGALSYSFSVIILRRLAPTDSMLAVGFYTNLLMASLAGLMLPFQFVTPTLADLGGFAAMGLLNGLAVSALFTGYGKAPAAVVAPFQYSQMLWGVLAGYAVWGDIPDEAVGIGAVIVIASGLYILHRETRRQADSLTPVTQAIAPQPPERKAA